MNKESQTESLYVFGPFRVDPVERVLLRDGEPVALQPKLFDTLLALIERSGHVVEKDELMETIWPDAFVEESNLASNVSLLRKVLGANPNGKPYIETIARRGYRFSAEIKRIPHYGLNIVLRKRSRARLITTIEEERDEQPEDSTTPEALPEVGTGTRTIAILPFMTLGVEAHEEYLGLGLADALITQLANTKQMIVRPTSAIRIYAGTTEDSASVGRQLRVGAILEGSLQRAGERLRVTVRFINTGDGATLWAEKFNFNFTDIFEVQDEIAERVVNSLTLNLSHEEHARLLKRYTENAEAYGAYLKGRYFWNRRTVEGFRKAIDYFNQAIEIDPAYALAYSGLADVYNLLLIWGEASPQETCARAESAALKALEIDPLLAEAHASLGYNMICQWRWNEAEQSLKRAIELNPNYASARSWYANYLKSMDRFDEAILEVKIALQLDPLSPMIKTTLGANYMFARQFDPAIEQLCQVLDFDPDFVPALTCLGMAYGWQGRHAQAITLARKVFELAEGHPTAAGLLAARYAMAGERDAALRLLAELEDAAESNYGLTYSIAAVYACLDEKEKALAWLEKAYEDHNSLLNDLKVDAEFDNLRSDARFQDLARRLGLAANV